MSDIWGGDKRTIIFTPDTGYMIDSVLVNGVETIVTENELTLVITENTTVEVTYKKISLTITIKEASHATIMPGGTIFVDYGDDYNFVITTDEGYQVAKIFVNQKEQELDGNTLRLSNITQNLEVEVLVESDSYPILEGENASYRISEDGDLKIRIDADYSLFENQVYVDGNWLDTINYTSSSGSTIITLKRDYLNTLTEGEHTICVVFKDGKKAETKFYTMVAEEITKTANTEAESVAVSSPDTSDPAMPFLMVTICVVSVFLTGNVALRQRNCGR